MMEAWERWGSVIIATAVAIPAAAVLIAAMSRCRRRNGAPAHWARRTSAAEVVAILGTVPWLWMIFTPGQAPRAVHLVPLSDLADLAAQPPATIVVQLVGNLLVFAAAGFCLPIRFAMGIGSVTLAAVIGSLTVESAQYLLDIGRVSSIDDVIVNAAGAAIAALLSRRWWLSRSALVPLPVGSSH